MPVGTTTDLGSLAIQSALADTGITAARQDPRFASLDGSGVTTVVIDTGIDVNHPFFGADADGDGIDDRILYQYDFADGDADASDVMGHGSHVASLIGSQDAVYPGVAPCTDLISLKVFSDSGTGYFSYLEQALQWVIAHQDAYHIGVVNLSLGDGGDWTDTFSRYGIGDELAALADMDIIMVAAAGNNYYQFGRPGVAYPAADPAVIAVGATWAADFGGPWHISTGATDYTTSPDQIASFSQRDADLLDTFAPGARFNGANATGGYKTMEGTSQAAAFVSGVAALSQQLAQEELGRNLTTAEFAYLLQVTGDTIVDGDNENDNVVNTGLQYPRVNFASLAEYILTLGQTAEGGGAPGDGGNGSDGLLELAAPGVHQVALAAGQIAAGNDFGNFQLGEIRGTAYDDEDGDGARGAAEPLLASITVFLDADGNGVLDPGEGSTVTAADGSYVFADLGPGTYRVAEVLPAGWAQTAPAGGSHEVSMTSGLSASARDFGNRRLNVAPVNTLPGAQTVNEDTALVFSTTAGNAISIGDLDAGANLVEVTLTGSHGVLTLSGTTGLTFFAGDGAADSAMTFRGAPADINAALNGLRFGPAANFNGAAGITLITNDLGNTGAGGPLSDSDTVGVTVRPVNDNPVTKGDAATFVKNTAVTINVLANDTDVDGDPLSIASFTLTAHGTVVKNSNGTFTYTPATNYTGSDSFKYTVSDGHGGTSTNSVLLTGQQSRTLPPPPPPPPPPRPLLASGEPAGSSQGSTVTDEALAAIVAEAKILWSQASHGTTLVLDQVAIQIADLPGLLLGQTSGNTIIIDANAAGYGWFIDPTPAASEEFSGENANGEMFAGAASPASGKMDLLTTVMHELGHALGLEHQSQGVMEPTLQAGERLIGTDSSSQGQGTTQAPLGTGSGLKTSEKVVMLFDDKLGKFFRPGLAASLLQTHDWRFDPAQWEGAGTRTEDNGDDWIVKFTPRKLHG